MNSLRIVLVIFAFSSGFAQLTELNLVSAWNQLQYEYSSEADMQRAIDSGAYVPGNGVPIDVAVHYINSNASSSSSSSPSSSSSSPSRCNIRNILKCLPIGTGNGRQDRARPKVFVTVPRFQTGIPLTLATVSDKRVANGPLLSPYPNWEMNQGQTCGGIISVFRVAKDECNRLWVLDTGRIGDNQLCPPQLLVFNLDDDSVIRKFQFAKDLYAEKSVLITLVVDVRDATTCSNTMVYIADVAGFGLLVYSYQRNTAWRFDNKLFYPNPDYGTFTIDGDSFDQMDGIFGLALTPKGSPNRLLYFHALASAGENSVPLSILDDSNNVDVDPRTFVEIGKRGVQSTAEAMDRNGNLFFGLIRPISVGCWDSRQPVYDADRIRVVVQNNQQLQFTSGMKVVLNDENVEELWVLSNRYQRAATGTLSSNDVNFRILGATINQILEGANQCTYVGTSLNDYQLLGL